MKVLLLGIESHKQDEVRSLHNRRATLKHAAVALATMRNHGIEAWGCFIINPDWVEQDFDDLATYVWTLYQDTTRPCIIACLDICANSRYEFIQPEYGRND
jgi:hypothetical protein